MIAGQIDFWVIDVDTKGAGVFPSIAASCTSSSTWSWGPPRSDHKGPAASGQEIGPDRGHLLAANGNGRTWSPGPSLRSRERAASREDHTGLSGLRAKYPTYADCDRNF